MEMRKSKIKISLALSCFVYIYIKKYDISVKINNHTYDKIKCCKKVFKMQKYKPAFLKF